MKVGLLFGSFNPIHIGHLIAAEMAIDKANLDLVMFVVSPANPDKIDKGILANEEHRLKMTELAIQETNLNFVCSNVEYLLPKPSYTYNTIKELLSKYKNHEFHFICGTDVYVDIPNWQESNYIIDNLKFVVYPRANSVNIVHQKMEKNTIWLNGVPSMDISSTFLREQIKNDRSTNFLIPKSVQSYIKNNKIYK